jgi:hypothetical protein
MAGRPGVITGWVLPKGFRQFHPPSPGFAWRTKSEHHKWATQTALPKSGVSPFKHVLEVIASVMRDGVAKAS